MGFTPLDVDRMSVFQFMSALDGYVQSQNPDGDMALSADETDDIWSWLQTKEPVVVCARPEARIFN